ncbi:hypothetical protein AB0953_05105 [Streptomyces sp. NPDC046866]|uniref:hypothetical protein n=1 Tax=Streptomyces sp. NPDC046866 TaxID=3154921 RepID=UPI0034547635
MTDDAKDARVIADQARMRPKGFAPLDTPPELVSTLRVLTPAALRRLGAKQLTTWLERRKVLGVDTVAVKAAEAAQSSRAISGQPGSSLRFPSDEGLTWGVVSPRPRGAVGDTDERPGHRPIRRNAGRFAGDRSA